MQYEIFCSYFVCHKIYWCNLRYSLLVEACFVIMLILLAPIMSIITRLQCISKLIQRH